MDRLRAAVFLALALLTAPALAADCDRDAFGSYADTRELMLQPIRHQGFFVDPYEGRAVPAAEATLEHVVSLCEAWRYGAEQWTDARRERFANDPANLVVVSRSANSSKADRPPSDWIPRNTAYLGEWLARRNLVIEKWRLTPPAVEIEAARCYQRFVEETGVGFRPGRWEC